MTTLQTISGALDDATRRERIYAGDLLIYTGVPPLAELCAFTDQLIRTAFGDLDPLRAQFDLDRETFVHTVESLQKQFRSHPEVRRLFRATLEHVGVDVHDTCWDWMYLRVLPHRESHASRHTSRLGFHRDTWSSNIYAQENWWAPIYLITADRTIAFYPSYWARPLQNNSHLWDLEAIQARKRSDASTGGPAIPVVPEPTEVVDTSSELRIVIEPGDLLCFSGAHLHASVPNVSGLTRFSLEVRTANAEDMARPRGAPNVDGQAPRIALGWFHRIADDTS